MTAKIIIFPRDTHGPLKADQMLRNIADEQPSHAFVITWPKDGKPPSYHSSTEDVPVIVHRLLTFLSKLYGGEYGDT